MTDAPDTPEPSDADAPSSASDKKSPAKRLLGLDALRGVAVFLMIEQHLGVWLWQGPGVGETMRNYPGLLAFNALGGGAAPAFVTLAGIGSSLLAVKREGRGESPDKTLILRGLAVLAFGYLLNFWTPSWFSWRSWFVLHLMGLGMLSTPIWRRLPTWAVLGLGVAVLAATGFVQAGLDVPLRLHNPYMAGIAPDSPQAWTGLRIAVAEGQFPIFPWFSFFLAGIACGRWVAKGELKPVASLAGGALCLGAIGLLLRNLGPAKATVLGRSTALTVPFFPASPTLVSLLLGAVLLGCWAVMAWERRGGLSENHVLVTLGRASLTLLILHVRWFREATRPIEWWRALSVTEALSVLLGFLVIAGLASRAWQAAGYRFGAEWLLREVGDSWLKFAAFVAGAAALTWLWSLVDFRPLTTFLG